MLVAIVASSIFAALPGVGSSTLLAMSMPFAMTLPPYECIALMFGITIISMNNNLFGLVWFLANVMVAEHGSALPFCSLSAHQLGKWLWEGPEFMRHPDVESGMKALVEASPDTVMQIIDESQPLLAKRIQDEPDPEKAKQLMLQAEDIWDDLIYMLAVTSGREAKKKVKNLMILYDQRRWNIRKGYNRYLLIKVLLVLVAVFFYLLWSIKG